MKLLIIGDTHLGRRNFKVKLREKDFENSFAQAVDYALKNKIDLLVHAGDLFDIGRPSINTIIFTIKELTRLKEAGIPVFITAGSHDIGVDGSFLKVLHELGLVINLSDKKYYSQSEEGISINGEVRKGVFVCGLPGRRSRINEILELLKPNIPENAFSIFLFHHIIEDINPLFSTVKKSYLPKGFNLYVSGHWHEFYETDYNGRKLLYPGSTESCDFREMRNGDKGFIIYNTENNSYEFVKVKTRNSNIIEVDCNDSTPEEVIEKIKKQVGEGSGEMLFFILKGKLKTGVKSELNKQEVYDLAKENGYLLCKIYTGSLENPSEAQTTIEKRGIKEIEKEFFKNKGLTNNEIVIAQHLIKDLGSDYSASKLENKITSVINWLQGEIL
jgi:DNA repair exonuclease SbcCD nuclease subunit